MQGRNASMLKSVSRAFLLASAAAVVLLAQNAPPKELIQYVRDAIKAGQNNVEIQQNAVNSGWPAATVTQAMALVHDQDSAVQPAFADDKGAPASPARPADTGAAAPAATNDPAGGTPKPAAGTVKPETINRGVPNDYKIGVGDILDINVWKEPEASVHGTFVRTDGKISMPLLKDVDVVGLTPLELEKLITDKLSGMINTPDVTIMVGGTASKKIYIQGQVNKQGPIPFTYNMTVMQALMEAGGITIYAKKSKIYVLRTENGKAIKLPFDYSAVLKGQRLELNIQLQAGDYVIVP